MISGAHNCSNINVMPRPAPYTSISPSNTIQKQQGGPIQHPLKHDLLLGLICWVSARADLRKIRRFGPEKPPLFRCVDEDQRLESSRKETAVRNRVAWCFWQISEVVRRTKSARFDMRFTSSVVYRLLSPIFFRFLLIFFAFVSSCFRLYPELRHNRVCKRTSVIKEDKCGKRYWKK